MKKLILISIVFICGCNNNTKLMKAYEQGYNDGASAQRRAERIYIIGPHIKEYFEQLKKEDSVKFEQAF